MSGFANIGEWANADLLGQCWFTGFRKTVASAATTTNAWIDYSYFAGSPPANFYASSPSVAAVVESDKGFKVPTVSPSTQRPVLRSPWPMLRVSLSAAGQALQR
jgi:hypothetical protein